LFAGTDDDAVARLERAFQLVVACDPIRKKLRQAHIHDGQTALQHGLISEAEAAQLEAAKEAVSKVVEVDDFAPEDLSPAYAEKLRQMSELARSPRAAVG
jgi:acyl-CoA dehydrogenase